jgi:hypothetical protein
MSDEAIDGPDSEDKCFCLSLSPKFIFTERILLENNVRLNQLDTSLLRVNLRLHQSGRPRMKSRKL